MAQVLINASGFSNLPATAPAGWPSNITWPSGISPNTAVTITMNDAAFQAMLTWIAGGARNSLLGGTSSGAPGPAPTSQQLLSAWLNILVTGSITATQQYQTQPATPPSPIVITGV